MARPNKKRNVEFSPNVKYFKPRGIPLRELEEVTLTMDECESLRLADFIGLSHADAGREMGVSRATFGRIVQKARKNVAEALIHGLAIRIEGLPVQPVKKKENYLECVKCSHQWMPVEVLEAPVVCPECRHEYTV